MSKRPILLHVLPSYYSAIARLLLVEKQVDFKSVIIDMHIGLEYFEPWYVNLNHNVTVPTFIHGDKVIMSSVEMLDYVDDHFDGPTLKPSVPDILAEMNRFVSAHNAIQIELLTMGTLLQRSHLMQKKMMKTLNKQLHICVERANKYPHLKKIYDDKKISVKAHLSDFSLDNIGAVREKGEQQVINYLSKLEGKLGDKAWLLGEQYTLCDVVNTSLFARLSFIKREDMLKNYPKCDAYYKRLKARPSFKKAKMPNLLFPPHILLGLFFRILRQLGIQSTSFLQKSNK